MSEPQPVPAERKRGPRRNKAEIAADYERRAARIKWSGMRGAVKMLDDAYELAQEAQAAAGDHGTGAPFATAMEALGDLARALEGLIPPEAR